MTREDVLNMNGLTRDEAAELNKIDAETFNEALFMDNFHLYVVKAEQRKTKDFWIFAKDHKEAEKICKEKIENGSLDMKDAFEWGVQTFVDYQYN